MPPPRRRRRGRMREPRRFRDNVRATQAGLNKKMTDAEMRELLKPPPLIPLSRADIQKKARMTRSCETKRSLNFKNRDLTDKIKINDLINDSNKKSGHFFIFHELSAKIQERILLRNSCYTSYSFKNSVESIVHGNLPVLAENQSLP